MPEAVAPPGLISRETFGTLGWSFAAGEVFHVKRPGMQLGCSLRRPTASAYCRCQRAVIAPVNCRRPRMRPRWQPQSAPSSLR